MSVLLKVAARLFNTTTTPASTASGDMWYRSDLDQVHASDGAAGVPVTVGPIGNVPAPRPAGWHVIPPFGPAGSASVPASRMFALPFAPGRTCTLTAMAASVTVAVAGGSLRMGLYASDGVLPTTLVADYGTVTVGVTGIRQINGLSTVVRPVLHYLVLGRQGGLVNLGLVARDTGDPYVTESAVTMTANLNAYYIDGVAGALPASFGTPAGTIQGPAVSVQLT